MTRVLVVLAILMVSVVGLVSGVASGQPDDQAANGYVQGLGSSETSTPANADSARLSIRDNEDETTVEATATPAPTQPVRVQVDPVRVNVDGSIRLVNDRTAGTTHRSHVSHRSTGRRSGGDVRINTMNVNVPPYIAGSPRSSETAPAATGRRASGGSGMDPVLMTLIIVGGILTVLAIAAAAVCGILGIIRSAGSRDLVELNRKAAIDNVHDVVAKIPQAVQDDYNLEWSSATSSSGSNSSWVKVSKPKPAHNCGDGGSGRNAPLVVNIVGGPQQQQAQQAAPAVKFECTDAAWEHYMKRGAQPITVVVEPTPAPAPAPAAKKNGAAGKK